MIINNYYNDGRQRRKKNELAARSVGTHDDKELGTAVALVGPLRLRGVLGYTAACLWVQVASGARDHAHIRLGFRD